MTAAVRRRNTGPIVYLVPLLAGVLGLVAAGAIWSRETARARQRDDQSASQMAAELAKVAGTSVDGLRGASAIVADDGSVSDVELRVYADDMAGGSQLRAVAHELLVQDADRAEFERTRGYAISDIGPDGTLVPAAQRAEYAPVVAVAAVDPTVTPSYGLDILGDPARSEAVRGASDSGVPTISPPISLVPSGRTGYLSVTALRLPDGTVIGYLSGSFAIQNLVDAASAALAEPADVALFDQGERVAGDVRDGATATLVIGGRTLEVRADAHAGRTWWPSAAVALGAVLASVALAMAIRSLRRSERAASTLAEHLDAERTQAIRLADLGRELTSLRSRDQVVTLLGEVLPAVTSADQVTVSFVDGTLLRPVGQAGLVPLDTHLPATEAARESRVVTVEDVEGYQRAHPDLQADARARRLRSAAAVPLVAANGESFGVLGLAWHERRAFTAADEVALTTLGALVAGTVQRVDAAADAVRHADALVRLAEELAVATTIDQVVSASAVHLPSISDAADVRVAGNGDHDDGAERHVLTDTSGDPVGELVVAWPTGHGPDDAQQERLQTAIDLIDETVRRVDIQRATSQAVLSLRQRLMRPLPTPAGLDLAARYRPTSRPLGMGGDWYDVVERPDGTVGIVIGDVVGHGIPAIATMIHVSTILGGLVRAATPAADLIGRAGAMLDADGMVGTAQILIIDPAGAELTMVSAGHPPALLRRPDGIVERLAEATHAPLGVGSGAGSVVRVPFPAGSCVLGYTDGLVERRGEAIDSGISRLASAFAATNGSVWGSLSDVLAAMAPDGDDRGTDDVAVVIARHR